MIIKCNKCKQDKECELFSKRSKSKTGYNDWCKICQKEYNTQYYINNKHIIDEYKNKNKDKINQYNEQYRKSYYQNNKNHILDISKQYYELNKEQLLEKQKVISKRHYQNNKEHHKHYKLFKKVRALDKKQRKQNQDPDYFKL